MIILIENSQILNGDLFLFGNNLTLIDYAFAPFLNNMDIIFRNIFEENLFVSINEDIQKKLSFAKNYLINLKEKTEFLTINEKLRELPNIEKIPILKKLGVNSLKNYSFEKFCVESYRKYSTKK